MSTTIKCLAVLLAATSLLLTGCNDKASVSTDNGKVSAEAGPLEVDKDRLSSDVQSQLNQQLGERVPMVTCPNNLAADVGATTTCTMNRPDGVYNITVTVTKVDWTGFGNFGVGNAEFDTQVADQPQRPGN